MLAGTGASRALICTLPNDRDIQGALFNRDETQILVWDASGIARLWALDRNEVIQTFESVGGAVFSSDNRRILTWGVARDANGGVTRYAGWRVHGKVQLWTLGQLEPTQIFKDNRYATFSPDESRILTLGDDEVARLWTIGQGEPIQTFAQMGGVHGAVFNHDGSQILTWTGSQMLPAVSTVLWAVGQSQPIQSFEHKWQINGAAFSPDGSRILTWGADETARLWTPGHSNPTQTFEHKRKDMNGQWVNVNGAVFNRNQNRTDLEQRWEGAAVGGRAG
jgi:WD40 repeat protein